MADMNVAELIAGGKTALGIELGSTRVKAVLIDDTYSAVAQGGFEWENRLVDGVWTYRLDEVWTALAESFSNLRRDVQERYGVPLTRTGALGISAMMHGYLVFDKNGEQLAPFRTWRNTMTAEAAEILSREFSFNIPQRWSVAHLYQALLNKEDHTGQIAFMTTLAGYVHWKLTGEKTLGIGDASGMFPIDSVRKTYHKEMLRRFDRLSAPLGFNRKLEEILPRVLCAGSAAASLSAAGARLLDPRGELRDGIPLCPPEGDAGTGMTATNSVACRTGNVSAGTSIFAMLVLEKELSKPRMELDMVTTPGGLPVAMVHCNNCTSDIDAWVRLFHQTLELCGAKIKKNALYDALYLAALEGEADCDGIVSFNYYSGEPISGVETGRPLLFRAPESRLTVPNFMRALLFATMTTLRLGMDILTKEEGQEIRGLLGHGGLFKTPGAAQRLMAAALNTPITVMESAGEGGAWGIALLAAFAHERRPEETLESFLESRVFAGNAGVTIQPDSADVRGFDAFLRRWTAALPLAQPVTGVT
jgi:sugar (pentulose or hexulose) kinase